VAQQLDSLRASAVRLTEETVGALTREFSDWTPQPPWVQSRVKSDEAVRRKRARVGAGGRINDFIGMRVVLAHGGLVEEAVQRTLVRVSALDLHLVDREARLHTASRGGYRALHLDFVLGKPAERGMTPEAGVEIQFTTLILLAHALQSHELVYRSDRGGGGLIEQLNELGDRAAQLDQDIAALSRTAAGG
jgi:ppGpp synthetase/RelA/SpoT-type nucleotidyltranferase